MPTPKGQQGPPDEPEAPESEPQASTISEGQQESPDRPEPPEPEPPASSTPEEPQGPPDEPETPEPEPQDSSISPQDFAKLRADLVRAVSRECPSWLADCAEDLVQEVLIRIFKIDSKRKQDMSQFSWSYLRKSAYNAVIDEIRRRRDSKEESWGDNPEGPSMDPDTERLVVSREIGLAIRNCLKGLIRPRRLAVTLRLLGHSVPDLARRLGLSAKQAENLVYRGLADLRACLERSGVRP